MDELIATCQALNIDANELTKPFTIWRFETLHVRGVDQLTSEDIYNYFGPIHPHSVEWLSNISCNVTFDSSAQACNALQAIASALIIHKNENPHSDSMASIPNFELEVRSSDSLEIPVPPNYRYILGSTHEKAKAIIIRFATINDKKITSTGGPIKPEAVLTTPHEAVQKPSRSAFNRGSRMDERMDEDEPVVHRSFNTSRFKTENPSLRMRMHADEEEQLVHKNVKRTVSRNLSSRLGDGGDLGPRIIRQKRDSAFSRLGGGMARQPTSVVKSKDHIWRRSNSSFSNGRQHDLRQKLAAKDAMVRVRVSYDDW